MNTSKLPYHFYSGTDVLQIAKDLLGKVLVSCSDGALCTSGMIVETEAYTGEHDKAAHVYGGKRTRRTETMYGRAGHAYIYLCYGIHHLLNVVTHSENVPHAVLIRALAPLEGIELMMKRRNKTKQDITLTRGPGSLCQALGIHYGQSGESLLGDRIWIEDRGIKIPEDEIESGPRIGVAYAQEDALLPYRFWIRANPYVSKPPPYPPGS